VAIKAKAKLSGDIVDVKVLMKHPMETGQRVDSKTKEKIPAHHINEVDCTWNGEVVFHANLGPAVSKNPYLSFKLKGPKAGDTLQLSSIDNKGETDSGEVAVK
jgi:sulfur-oxidizing protein SoxZ